MRYQLQGHSPRHLICLLGLACDRPDSHMGMVTLTLGLWTKQLLARLYRPGVTPPKGGRT